MTLNLTLPQSECVEPRGEAPVAHNDNVVSLHTVTSQHLLAAADKAREGRRPGETLESAFRRARRESDDPVVAARLQKEEADERACELLLLGVPPAMTARQTGVAPGRVQHLSKKLGLKWR